MTYAMAGSIFIEKRSLKWWSTQTEISERTLAFWTKCYGAKAPYSGEKMVKILSYGYGKAQKAVGSSQDKAVKNLHKIERAIAWL
jgi:hypothetical protein